MLLTVANAVLEKDDCGTENGYTPCVEPAVFALSERYRERMKPGSYRILLRAFLESLCLLLLMLLVPGIIVLDLVVLGNSMSEVSFTEFAQEFLRKPEWP